MRFPKLKPLLRLAVSLVILSAVGWTAITATAQLNQQPLELHKIKLPWLLLSGVFYFAAMMSGCFFWHRIVRTLGYPVRLRQSARAFFASQLGKYVPGKAMVVIIRSSELKRVGVPLSVGVSTVFLETLTWIAVGAAIGASVLCFLIQQETELALVAAALGLLVAVPTAPQVFRFVGRRLNWPWVVINRLNGRLIAQGWIVLGCGWICNGMSLWCVVQAIPGLQASWGDFWLCLACVSLATVLGFLSFIPGGLGVRELVMVPLLGGRFGIPIAIATAILNRLVWIAVELLAVGIMYFVSKVASPGLKEAVSDGVAGFTQPVEKEAA